jgi:hypothetical protein
METRIRGVLSGESRHLAPWASRAVMPKRSAPTGWKSPCLASRGTSRPTLSTMAAWTRRSITMPSIITPAWIAERPGLTAAFSEPGAFGENISTLGWREETVCIGDRFRMGTALVEISQGRQPCWKLGHRFGDPAMVDRVVKTGRCGWYYRVIEPEWSLRATSSGWWNAVILTGPSRGPSAS